MKRFLLSIVLSLAAVFAAATPSAASTANQVLPGYLTVTPQTGCAVGPCFVPTGATPGSPTDAPCTLPATVTSCSQVATEKAIANAVNSPPPLGTTGGWTPLRINALTTTAVAIKGTAGQLGMIMCFNNAAATTYFQVFNVAQANVTVGTTLPTLSFPVAAGASAGFALPLVGMQFSTAMSIAATTTATGNSAPGTAADCNVGFN